ncbi:hypothetical protein [Pontiella agarivorans]|uniref:Auto-transporter adhesin head GIN domain-containing protein n=1 Tax=Pontiella agarivorans TaxID=3038953 RepID=A0ABU5N0V9_9BACT|nr:hypothetical protein [Pontiella agarivorans]MDZ8120075.1 hypothetical protein [Pontiella agarivorans]
MKFTLQSALVLTVLCGIVSAQVPDVGNSVDLYDYFDSGDGIEGINVPYYGENGELQARIFGGYAKLLDNAKVEVKNIRIDVYDKGRVIMTIYAPQCFTTLDEAGDVKVLRVYSDGEVLIEMEQMTVAGRGFRFSSAQNRFEILEDSRVLIKKGAREMEGVDL